MIDIDELPLSVRLRARSGTSKYSDAEPSIHVADTSKETHTSPCSRKNRKSKRQHPANKDAPNKRHKKSANYSSSIHASNIFKHCAFLIARTYTASQYARLRREIERAGGKVRIKPSGLIDYCVQSYSDEAYDERLESICNDHDIAPVPPAFVRDCIAHNRLYGLQEWFFGVDPRSRAHPLNEFNPRSALALWTRRQTSQPMRQVAVISAKTGTTPKCFIIFWFYHTC